MPTCAATAMHLETSMSDEGALVVIMPNLELLMKSERSWIFSAVPGSSLFFSLYLGCASAIITGMEGYAGYVRVGGHFDGSVG